MGQLKSALKISNDFKEGAAFDLELQERKREERLAKKDLERKEKKRERKETKRRKQREELQRALLAVQEKVEGDDEKVEKSAAEIAPETKDKPMVEEDKKEDGDR